MTRRCADSVTVADLPDGFDLYLGYDDSRCNNLAAVKARFPGKTVIATTCFAQDDEGDMLDVENGDATPDQAPGWVTRRRQAGHAGPLVYCSEATWPEVRQAFMAQGVPEPGYFVAGYPGSAGAGNLYPGSVGHQWIDHGPYDESVVVDYLPGIDQAPATAPASSPDPPVPSLEDPNVTSEQYGGSVHIFGHDANNQPCHWWQSLNEGVPAAQADWAWHVEKLPNG